jgi:glycosyltransferase 2 family protein
MMNTLRRLMKILIPVAIVIAAVLVYRSLKRYSFDDITSSISAIDLTHLATALVFVILSYLSLSLFDALAVRYAGKPLSLKQTALASFTALSIGHNVGMAALSSGAVRYRFYTRWGLTAHQVAKVIVFCGVTVGLGLATLGGLALLVDRGRSDLLDVSGGAGMALAFACLAVPAFYLAACLVIRRPIRLRSFRFDMPSPALAIGQIVIGAVNFAFVAGAVHALLLAFADVDYLQVASAYVTANIAVLLSHVPGGLGVLEATISGILPGPSAIGAMIVFRVLYFFLPLAIGLPLLLISEAYYRRRGRMVPVAERPAGSEQPAR